MIVALAVGNYCKTAPFMLYRKSLSFTSSARALGRFRFTVCAGALGRGCGGGLGARQRTCLEPAAARL